MEDLYFLKFWKPISTTAATTVLKEYQFPCGNTNSDTTHIPKTTGADMGGDQFDEADDSFFELELTVPDFDNCCQSTTTTTTIDNKNNHPLDKDSNSFDSELLTTHNNSAYKADNQLKFQQPTLSLSPTHHNFFFKRKIFPIEPVSKPQSPVSFLLNKSSAPRFQILMFKKAKSMAAAQRTGETELSTGVFVDTQKKKKQESSSSKFFTLKFKFQEGSSVAPTFTRENSLGKQIADDSLSDYDHSSKRFSMELIHKYMKLFKPLYIKRAKQTQKSNFSGELSAPSFPNKEKLGNIPAGIRVVCKHLGKSKSASASASASASTGVSPSSRRHDSLLLQFQHDHDGIQSAILHCKKSFNSSTDSSLLSRFTSDPLLEQKSMASQRICHQDNGIK